MAGEGKTMMSIGLYQPNPIGKKGAVTCGNPHWAPCSASKAEQQVAVTPGDSHDRYQPAFHGRLSAIEKANNLLSALIDNNIQNKTHSLDIDPRTIVWKRVMDMNDRALRHIVIGIGGSSNGGPEKTVSTSRRPQK